jgi:hypothetical protein
MCASPADLFGVANYTEILGGDIERIAGGQIWIWKYWRRLLGEDDPIPEKQESDGTNKHRGSFTRRGIPASNIGN